VILRFMDEISCLEEFLRGLINPEFLHNVLLEAEELASNVIFLRFNFRCSRGLVKEILVSVLYTFRTVVRTTVEVILAPDVQARDFILRVYPSLIGMGCGVDLSSEGIRVYKVYRCGSSLGRSFTEVVQEILSVFEESCEILFKGDYRLEILTSP